MATSLSLPYRLTTGTFRRIFTFGYRQKCFGLENVPKSGGCILAGNHVSYLDPPCFASFCPRQPVWSFARKTLFKPGIGWWFRRLYMIGVDRDKGSDLPAFRRVLQLLNDGQVVQMFPEGTRSPNGVLQRGKKGIGWFILKANVPVVPMRIFGTFEAWPKGKRLPSFKPQLTLVFGKPLSPDVFVDCKNEADPFQAASDKVMQAIANLYPPSEDISKNEPRK